MKIKIGLFMAKDKAQVVLRKLIDATLTDFDLSRCEYDESEKRFTFDCPYFWAQCMPNNDETIGRRFHFVVVDDAVLVDEFSTNLILSSIRTTITSQRDIIQVGDNLGVRELYKEQLKKEAPRGLHSSSGDINYIINSILLIKGVGYTRANFLK